MRLFHPPITALCPSLPCRLRSYSDAAATNRDHAGNKLPMYVLKHKGKPEADALALCFLLALGGPVLSARKAPAFAAYAPMAGMIPAGGCCGGAGCGSCVGRGALCWGGRQHTVHTAVCRHARCSHCTHSHRLASQSLRALHATLLRHCCPVLALLAYRPAPRVPGGCGGGVRR